MTATLQPSNAGPAREATTDDPAVEPGAPERTVPDLRRAARQSSTSARSDRESVQVVTIVERTTEPTTLPAVPIAPNHATARWISGDRSGALGEAFRDTRMAMYQIARRIAGHDNAADITQDVLLRIWNNPDRFDPQRGSLAQYLRMTTRGVSIDFVRKDVARKHREDRATSIRPEMSVDITQDVLDRERARHVVNAVNALRTNEREPIIEAFYRHRTYQEIAANNELPEGTVKSRIRVGLMCLRAQMRTIDRPTPNG